MKTLIRLSILFSIILLTTTSYAMCFKHRGMEVGKEIPDYALSQFEYDYTQNGIDYYTANSSTNIEVERISVYKNKLLSIDIITLKLHRLTYVAMLMKLRDEFGSPNLTSKKDYINEMTWNVDSEHSVTLSINEQEKTTNICFLSVEVLKQYLSEVTLI